MRDNVTDHDRDHDVPISDAEARGEPTAAEITDAEGEVLAWSCHPVRRRPLISVLVTIFIFVVTAAVFYSTNSRLFAILALVVLLASLAKFYFPTGYRLSGQGITIKTTTQTLVKKWSQYRSCYSDRNGILLSPFPHPSRLENFRGIYLMFSGNGEAVTDFVKAHISAAETQSPLGAEDKTA